LVSTILLISGERRERERERERERKGGNSRVWGVGGGQEGFVGCKANWAQIVVVVVIVGIGKDGVGCGDCETSDFSAEDSGSGHHYHDSYPTATRAGSPCRFVRQEGVHPPAGGSLFAAPAFTKGGREREGRWRGGAAAAAGGGE